MPATAQWKVIHLTRSRKHADMILDFLARESVLARCRQVYRKVSSEDNYYEILTPGSEAPEAQQLLIEHNLLL